MEATVKPWIEYSSRIAIGVAERWAHLVLIILAVIIILPGLGDGSLRDWDEAIYAQVSKEMIRGNDWINLYHGYEPYFEKPPLLMWAIAVLYKLFGVDELWSRVPSALSGILLVYVTYLCGKEIYGSRTGLMAGVVLLSSYGFVYQARNGTTNMPLSLFVFTGMFAYLRLKNGSQSWWYLIWTSCAFAFLMKHWGGLVLPIVLAVVLIMEQRIAETLRSKHFWLGALLALLLVAPWFVLVYLKYGQAVTDAYVTRNLLQRTFTVLEGHDGQSLFYLDILRQTFSPWYFLTPFAIVIGIREIFGSWLKSTILIVEIFLIMGLYTFIVGTKLPWYILPVYPALSIFIAYLFVLAMSSSKSDAFPYVISAFLTATIITQDKLLILFVLIGAGLMTLIRKGLILKENTSRIIAGLVFVVFMLISIISYVLGNHRLPVQPIYKVQDAPVAQIATLAGKANPSTEVPLIGLAMPEDWDTNYAVEGPAAMFYSNRPVVVAVTWADFYQLLLERDAGEMLVAEKYLENIPEEFEILVLERADPLVYATFSR